MDVPEHKILTPPADITLAYKIQQSDGPPLVLATVHAEYYPVAESSPTVTLPPSFRTAFDTGAPDTHAVPTSTIYKVAGRGRISIELETENMEGVKHKLEPAYMGGYLISGYRYTTVVQPATTIWTHVPMKERNFGTRFVVPYVDLAS